MAHILIIDDDATLCLLLERILANDTHTVTTAETGENALQLVRSASFDLALVDLQLPDIHGKTLIASLRDEDPTLAIIILTGHATLDSAIEALRHGAYDYLFKPCKTVELREAVQRTLRERERTLRQQKMAEHMTSMLEQLGQELPGTVAETASVSRSVTSDAEMDNSQGRFINVGPLTVDLLRHVITLQGELLELSPTEYDLLVYLINEAPRVVSSHELVQEIQGYSVAAEEAGKLIRPHIYRIRKKIRDIVGSAGLIRTVHGTGYAIDL